MMSYCYNLFLDKFCCSWYWCFNANIYFFLSPVAFDIEEVIIDDDLPGCFCVGYHLSM